MKRFILYFSMLLALMPLSGNSEQPIQSHAIEFQQQRRSDRHDVELSISANLPKRDDLTNVKFISVTFTVKNISKETIGILHVGENYRDSVEICLADKIDGPNGIFPMSPGRGGSPRKIAPGESIEFYIDVPIGLMNGKIYIAGVSYGTATFEGEAFSKPFSFPSLIPVQKVKRTDGTQDFAD
ncbi:MAG: hypothetical protein PHQ12_06200 [Chthoniobacteraceae bacterium]|nr:hypothetical protein [Chthoniobacteraceae bacterium]